MAKLFKNLTLKEQYKMYFESVRGAKEIPSKNKYSVLEWVTSKGDKKYILLGSSGSVRANSKPVVANSFSIASNALKDDVKKWAIDKGYEL